MADVAHPINVGGHGDPDSSTGEVIENLTFRNVDILEHDEDDPMYQGCMTVDCGDRNRVRNVLFEDIRVEHIQEGRLFYVKSVSIPSTTGSPAVVSRGLYSVISLIRESARTVRSVQGLSRDGMVRNVTFENVIINGEKMSDLKEAVTNEFISNVSVK